MRRLLADREQMNRKACARNLSAFQDAYMSVVRQYETAIRRDECWRIVQEKDSAIRKQQMELAQQKEREQRLRNRETPAQRKAIRTCRGDRISQILQLWTEFSTEEVRLF